MEVIELEGARLRPWRRSDAASIANLANDKGVWRNLGTTFPHPYRLEHALQYIEQGVDLESHRWAIEIEGAAVGGAGLRMKDAHREGCAELGYWLGRPHWGQGKMTRIVAAIVEAAFDQLGLVRLEAQVFSWNAASARVLEKNGFQREGRLREAVEKEGEVGDIYVYGRLPGGPR
jgi:RimJ/RimL family protein N-acetyltransferase